MTDWSGWFQLQLESTADGLVWAMDQIKADNHFRKPPDRGYMGDWPPARHLWHVARYEHVYALPAMRVWLGQDLIHPETWRRREDAEWEEERSRGVEAFTKDLRLARTEQLAMLEKFSDSDWEQARATYWGQRPLRMIVTKTYQHTLEHTDALLRMGLWWNVV